MINEPVLLQRCKMQAACMQMEVIKNSYVHWVQAYSIIHFPVTDLFGRYEVFANLMPETYLQPQGLHSFSLHIIRIRIAQQRVMPNQ